MIIRPHHHWFRLLFVWKGSVLQAILPQLIFVAAVSSLAVLTHGRVFGEKIPLNTAPFTLFGLALAIFLAFRNNASYERFKEARLLWGELLISARTLCSQALAYLPADGAAADARRRVPEQLVAFAYALKHQLRGTDALADLRRLLGPAGEQEAQALAGKSYRPAALLDRIRHSLAAATASLPEPGATRWLFEQPLDKLGHALGGCERIAATPIPYSYSVLLHRTVYAYCVLLPFGLVDSTELFTPLICVLISYTLIALEAIANEVGDPFGLAPNALALDAMTRTIERAVLEQCGRPLPSELQPDPSYQLT